MDYRQLLVSVDLQHDVSYLLQRASKLAQLMAARLHVLSVLPLDEPFSGLAGSESLLRLKQESLDYLTRQVATLPCQLGECRVESGSVAAAIQRTLAQLHCDLLILGAQQHAGFTAGLVGELAVLPHHHHDVLVLDGNRPFWSQPLTFQLFLPLNEEGKGLLVRADRVTRALDAKLAVVSVLETPVGQTEQQADAALSQAEHQLADWLVRLPHPPQSWQVVRGDLGLLLAQARASVQSQLLIVGAGRTQAAHLIMGSHVPALLQQAHGDLLILH